MYRDGTFFAFVHMLYSPSLDCHCTDWSPGEEEAR